MMMKKILVLVLVLGLASTANAALFISVGGEPNPGEIEVKPSDTVVLDIHGDDPTDGGPAEAYMLVEGPGSITGGTLIYGGGLAVYLNAEELAEALELPDAEALIQAWSDALGKPDLSDVSYGLFADSDIPPNDFLNGPLVDEIAFHCEGEGLVTVTLVDQTFENVLDTLAIVQVPEPMTFALLGLGGLFLRRRK